ncbi:unnamed protein product [Arabidopsis halleri]
MVKRMIVVDEFEEVEEQCLAQFASAFNAEFLQENRLRDQEHHHLQKTQMSFSPGSHGWGGGATA